VDGQIKRSFSSKEAAATAGAVVKKAYPVDLRSTPIARDGHSEQADRAGLALAEWLCRTVDRIDPA
jgi:hypothetical protein